MGKFRGKLKIMSTRNLLYQKFATVCWNSVEKLQAPAPITLLSHDTAE